MEELDKDQNIIALVANTSWSIYNFRLGLIRRLQSEGFQVAVIAPKDSFTSKLVAEGIEYFEIDMSNYGTNPIADFTFTRDLYKLYQQIKPNLIFHYTIKPNIYGTMAARMCGIPSIIVTTGLGHLFEFSNLLVRWITLFMYRIAAKLTKEVWFLNENDRDVFVYKRIVRRSKTKLLRSEGVDTLWFKPRKDKKFYIDRFLFAGRLLWDKGVHEFVEAAKIIKERYPRVRFEIIGFIDQHNPNSVPYGKILEWQKQKWIKYHGETSDIRPYLEKATCLVFPSFYREGISRILLEASAMETPIITTDNVGCREVVDDGKTGFLCEPKDVNSLVNAIEKFITMDNEDKLVMGKLGRKKVIREYEMMNINQKYLDTISRIFKTEPQPNVIEKEL